MTTQTVQLGLEMAKQAHSDKQGAKQSAPARLRQSRFNKLLATLCDSAEPSLSLDNDLLAGAVHKVARKLIALGADGRVVRRYEGLVAEDEIVGALEALR